LNVNKTRIGQGSENASRERKLKRKNKESIGRRQKSSESSGGVKEGRNNNVKR